LHGGIQQPGKLQPVGWYWQSGGREVPAERWDAKPESGINIALSFEGLRALGVKRGERVAILSETRAEWAIVDYACLTAGFPNVPVYPSLPADQIVFIMQDSEAVALFVSTMAQAKKIADIRAELPQLRHVVSFEPTGGRADMTLAELDNRGSIGENAESIRRYREEALRARPEDLATIIYTSGTTGRPKGVMLTHDNLYSNTQAGKRVLPVEGKHTALSFLPLSHVFERTAGHYIMFAVGASIAYAESFESVPNNLREVRPTLVLAVPRVFEKVYARAVETAAAGGAIKRRIFSWASRVGERWAETRLTHQAPERLLGLQHRIADRLVFAKLRARVGGRVQCFVSGAAPLSPEIHKFFFAAGLPILEGYGLTETSPIISANTFEHFRIGTVGKPLDGVEVQIAAEGEILTRGPHVMKGYHNNPEATRATIDADGWLHTGDVGVLEDGFLRITDRKKDMIVTAGGKNIAPQPIENRLKTSKLVSQAVMIGDRRRYPVMLIVPDFDALERWAKGARVRWTDRAELVALPEVRSLIQSEMQSLLRALATVSSLTMVSRVLGYARDFFIARIFGASLATDAFFVAFKIPNLLRRMFAEGAFSQAFVPILAGYRNTNSAEDTRALIDTVATLLFLALVVTAALGVAAAPLIVYLIAPGFAADPEKFALTVALLRITFPYLLFISLVALAAGILNTWNRFGVPALTPALLNVSFIV
jgi:long-chain acyl-CoA synthetase